MRTPLTLAEIEQLPASVDLPTAGRALNIGRTLAYTLARAGTFPVPVHRHGRAYRVYTADILAALRRDRPAQPAATEHSAGPTARRPR
ncbi:hypothetical protein [Pseudofrankia sp. DC12]|uniref:hypothetical protein n=1 Tax=Pseudofrankia sp. DC12 TaxID=683315 RepID=UPI0005F80474|nr:hypothetical protein [Pseudofrankia sp. DC12]